MVGRITPCLSSKYLYYNQKKLRICHILCHGGNLAPNVKMSIASNTHVRQSIIAMVFVRKTRQQWKQSQEGRHREQKETMTRGAASALKTGQETDSLLKPLKSESTCEC